MGMHLYHKSNTTDGIVKLSHLRPVKVSGKDGIVSKYIADHPNEDLEHWPLTPEVITQLLGEEKSDNVIIFSSQYEDTGKLSLSWVTNIHAKSSIMDTELLIMMQCLESVIYEESSSIPPQLLEYPEEQKRENVFESILVKGGISNLNHSWKLAPPKMQIGGVIRS